MAINGTVRGARIDCRRKVAGFAQAQAKTGKAQSQGCTGQYVRNGGQAPDNDGPNEALSGTYLINKITDNEKSQRISCLESPVNVPDLIGGDGNLTSESFVDQYQGKHLPVDVVDGSGKEQQCADSPAVISDLGRDGLKWVQGMNIFH
jgi:hypothetical protein